ncbi:MAG: hypothetical protein AB9907_06590 [Flexilinea sp.]
MNEKLKKAGIILLISIVAEVFLFNIRSFELIGSSSEQVIHFQSSTLAETTEDGIQKLILTVEGTDGIPSDLRNLLIQFENEPADIIKGTVHTDEKDFLAGHTRELKIIPGVEHSRHVYLYPSGRVTGVTIVLENTVPQNISLGFNTPVPIRINGYRLAAIFIFLLVLYVIRPGSPFYHIRFDLSTNSQKIVFSILILSHFAFLLFTAVSTYPDLKTMFRSDNFAFWNKDHYQLLTEAIKNRSFSLLAKPPEVLLTLDNPYDAEERLAKNISDAEIFWDTAYYHGKYYIYFGIMPVITLLLPFKLLTGDYLLNDFAVLLFAMIGSLGLLYCFVWILKHFFPDISVVVALIGASILLNSTGLVWCIRRPLSYELAMVSAFCFAVCGFAFNLSAFDNEKYRNLKLIAGCALMACAVGCRPTAVFISFLNIPIFLPLLFNREKDRNFRKNIGTALSILIPYSVVALFLVYYNFARFGSVTEFGQNYQLTIVDNRACSSGPPLSNYLLGIINLVFRGGTILSTDFPFLVAPDPLTFGFGGTKFWKNSFSAASICPLIYLLLFIPLYRTSIWNRGKFFLALFAGFTVIPLLIAAFVGSTVGTYQRYIMDFSWMLVLAGLIAAFMVIEVFQVNNLEKVSQVLLILCLIINLGYLITLFCGEAQLDVKNYFEFHNPIFFNKIAYSFMFWL